MFFFLGLEWNGFEWNHGVEWSGVDFSGVRWSRWIDGMQCSGVQWNGSMECSGLEWNGVDGCSGWMIRTPTSTNKLGFCFSAKSRKSIENPARRNDILKWHFFVQTMTQNGPKMTKSAKMTKMHPFHSTALHSIDPFHCTPLHCIPSSYILH